MWNYFLTFLPVRSILSIVAYRSGASIGLERCASMGPSIHSHIRVDRSVRDAQERSDWCAARTWNRIQTIAVKAAESQADFSPAEYSIRLKPGSLCMLTDCRPKTVWPGKVFSFPDHWFAAAVLYLEITCEKQRLSGITFSPFNNKFSQNDISPYNGSSESSLVISVRVTAISLI